MGNRSTKRNRKKSALLLVVGVTVALMTACGGPSKEKVKEVQEVYAQLVNRHNEVVEAYAGMSDETLGRQLDEMAENLNTIGQQDTKNMTDEELDKIIADLNENIVMYDDIYASMEEMKQQEEEEILAIPVTLVNHTGLELYQMYLYKASETDKGDNLVEDMEYLDGNATFNILNLYMTEEEMLWHLEAMDEKGNVIESADIDFTGYGEDGVTVHMKFSFDTMEGWVELE